MSFISWFTKEFDMVKEKTQKKYIGQKYNSLTIDSFSHKVPGRHYYNCICDCGNKTVTGIDRLKSGVSKSCGCLLVKENKKRKGVPWKNGDRRKINYNPRIKRIWAGIIKRCDDPNSTSYNRYGAKGISLCQEWYDWWTFEKWANENGYDDTLTIERVDNKGNYEPSNCRWATYLEQARNTSRNVYFEYNGLRLTSKEWSQRIGCNPNLVGQRIKMGWSVEKAVTTPPLAQGYTIKNEVHRGDQPPKIGHYKRKT